MPPAERRGSPPCALQCHVSGLRSQVSGLRSQVSGLRSQVSGLGSQCYGEGFHLSVYIFVAVLNTIIKGFADSSLLLSHLHRQVIRTPRSQRESLFSNGTIRLQYQYTPVVTATIPTADGNPRLSFCAPLVGDVTRSTPCRAPPQRPRPPPVAARAVDAQEPVTVDAELQGARERT
jgi:hypothetical protein